MEPLSLQALFLLLPCVLTQGRAYVRNRFRDNPNTNFTSTHTYKTRKRRRSEKGVMEGKEQILPIQSRNGGIVLETAQAISKSTGENTVKQSNVGKKRNPFGLVRAALLVFRRKKSKSVQAEIVSSKGLLTTLVGSMRPLHLQDHPPEPAPPPALTIDIFQEPEPEPEPSLGPIWVHGASSPSSSPFSSAFSSTGTMSQYASAQNLQELGRKYGCNNDEGIDEMEEEFLDDGDEMIDEKATEFIAKFYQQMRLQRDH